MPYGADEFIATWPQGYKRMLSRYFEDGIEPSGGQKQKLALAVIFYMMAPLIILDEPSSALDVRSTRRLWKFLFEETPNQTVVIATHDFSAIVRADQVIVLDQGRVVDRGTHSELYERCELYRERFDLQAEPFRDFGRSEQDCEGSSFSDAIAESPASSEAM